MSRHVDAMKRAIEFQSPPCVPVELVDVPYLYDAYDTAASERVTIPEGAEDFDSAWCTYHWTFKYQGKNEAGEPIRRDEWGCTQIIPNDDRCAYSVIDRPELASMDAVKAYPWPDPEKTNAFFVSRRNIIKQRYPDRFVCGFLDPGPFLTAFNLLGYDGLLMALCDNLAMVKLVLQRIFDYQIALVPKFKEMGAHMINIIDEVAGTTGMMFSREIFRAHFIPMYDRLLAAIHKHGMYTSILLDGNIQAILPDLMKMGLDQLFFAQPLSTGMDVIAECCRGKRCVKMAVDMMATLAGGTCSEIEAEVDEMVNKFHTDKGGLVFQALRWYRPEYEATRVKAQIDAMNKYR